MHSLISYFRNYCSLEQSERETDDVQNLISYFADYYRMCHPVESEQIRAGFGKIEPIMRSMSMKRQNRLFHIVSGLCEECESQDADLSFKTMFVMAVATSIDALAVGISLAMEGADIWLAVILIAAVTFVMCAMGVKIGSIFGGKFEKKAQIAGGVILILLAIKMLVEGILEKTGVL